MLTRLLLVISLFSMVAFSHTFSDPPPIEPGVSLELAKWRAAHYSDVRYKLDLTLEKMSPVLKGTIEIRVNVKGSPPYEGGVAAPAVSGGGRGGSPIILDWRKIKGHEEKSTISNVTINGRIALFDQPQHVKDGISRYYAEIKEHLIFYDNVVEGENVIKLDFTSPILTSGAAITRYIDKEDGSEYIYSLFVPSDASTAFPVFDQPDLKAKFSLTVSFPVEWEVVSNSKVAYEVRSEQMHCARDCIRRGAIYQETEPISTYVFAFAAGDLVVAKECLSNPEWLKKKGPLICVSGRDEQRDWVNIYVRKSQVAKFQPHAAEVFRLNREAIKYFEEYFDYKFPFPKYDLVLIPEFPFGGMEHAGATFLRESAIIFPQEPTRNDHISRALLIFHEASHQWFGDTVTMRWFDDLWLKEGFATFTAYMAMERIMPEMNAWKVFYERVKQAAYQTDSTKGTTPIYQEIKNLSAAKSAYGAIVYSKAPAFLRQAEFYLGEDKFQTAVRAFLTKHEFGNAGWEDLVREFEAASQQDLKEWAGMWVKQPGLPILKLERITQEIDPRLQITQESSSSNNVLWKQRVKWYQFERNRFPDSLRDLLSINDIIISKPKTNPSIPNSDFDFLNYQDYGYGIFLLDKKSREYVLKNIQNEKDPFLRSMMWGALWDSVRESELDPREYVELVVKVLSPGFSRQPPKGGTQNEDESTTALLLSRVGTAMNYYIDAENKGRGNAATETLQTRVEEMLIERMRNAETLGQRITYYRAFLNVAASDNARKVLKELLTAETQRRGDDTGGNLSGSKGVSQPTNKNTLPTGRVSASDADKNRIAIPLKTKDKFDIVTRLLILGDPEALKLLAELEKTETSDDAKRYAYAARAGIPTAESKAKYWNDFTGNKEISESWIEAAFVPFNSIRHSDLTIPYLQRALQELPNHKRDRKIFFVNGWLSAFIGGQRSEEALGIINKFLADNPNLDNDLRLKILENADLIERAVTIRRRLGN